MGKMAEKLREYLNSEEWRKSIEKHIRQENMEKERTNRYMDIAHNRMSKEERANFLEKCIKKENINNLYDYIFEYGERYGENVYSDDNYDDAYLIDDTYKVNVSFGVVSITKISENEVVPKLFKDKYCDVYKPNRVLLINIDDMVTFTVIRVQIKQKQLDGYYIMFDNKRYNIKPSGKLDYWPNGLFDIYINKLINLIP